MFSELDCSIEQEFCKAQEEEDSKQVQTVRGTKKKAGGDQTTHRGQVVWHLVPSSVTSLAKPPAVPGPVMD